MRNPFAKKHHSPPVSKPFLEALGVSIPASPYRDRAADGKFLPKAQTKKSFKMPSLGYLLIGLLSLMISGVSIDALTQYVPKADVSIFTIGFSFVILSVLSLYRAVRNWK